MEPKRFNIVARIKVNLTKKETRVVKVFSRTSSIHTKVIGRMIRFMVMEIVNGQVVQEKLEISMKD